MKKYRSLAIILAGALMLASSAGTCYASVTNTAEQTEDIIQATNESGDTVVSLVDGVSYTSHEKIGEVDPANIKLTGDKSAFTSEVTYKTFKKDASPEDYIDKTVVIDGTTYVLKYANSPKLTKTETVAPDSLKYTSELFTGDENDSVNLPSETVTDNGITYTLKSKELQEVQTQQRTEERESIIEYNHVEAGVVIPTEREETFLDAGSGEDVTAKLTLIDSEVVDRKWETDFKFPITVSDYNADVFYLGDTKVDKDDALVDYASEFLDYLGLDPDYYTISNITWDGPEYDEGGVIKRTATAVGSRYITDIKAHYEGEAVLPGGVEKQWVCEYAEDLPTEDGKLYTMTAEVSYELQGVATTTASDENGADGNKSIFGIITAIYDNIIKSFKERPLLTSIPLVLFALLIAFLIGKKLRNKCVYDKSQKCKYHKHSKEICATCPNFHKSSKV